MNKKVSVVITTHNRLTLLKRAIRSIKSQSYQPLEIIVVDDNSSDGTDNYFGNLDDKHITYFRLNVSSGANVARNIGLRTAKGDFVAFLDDDDFWESGKIECQLFELKNCDAKFSYTGLHNITPKGKTIKKRVYYPQYPSNIHKSLMANNFIGSTSSIMVDRVFCIDNNIFFDEKLASMQDYDFYIHFFEHSNKIATVEEYLTNYHQDRSIFKKKTSSDFNKFIKARNYLIEKYSKSEDITLLIKALNVVLVKKCFKYPSFFISMIKYLFNGGKIK